MGKKDKQVSFGKRIVHSWLGGGGVPTGACIKQNIWYNLQMSVFM